MSDDIVSGIVQVIQGGYEDSTQTVLDHQVAKKIHDYMLSRGWASPSVIAAVVEAAGGEVRVPERMLVDPPKELRTWQNPATRVFVLSTRKAE